MTDVRTWARDHGLDGLPVPAVFEEWLRPLGPHTFTTRGDDVRPNDLHRLRQELEGEVDDYLLLGADGHGTVSWAYHWHVVQGPVAILLQVTWGGVDRPVPEDTARVRDLVQQADVLRRDVLRAADRLPARRFEVTALDRGPCTTRWRDPDEVVGGGGDAAAALSDARAALAWALD